MEPFLRQVARHYFKGQDIKDTCFIFPNRRSMVFFRKYLADLVRALPCPCLPCSPLTISSAACTAER